MRFAGCESLGLVALWKKHQINSDIFTHHGATFTEHRRVCKLSRHCECSDDRCLCVLWDLYTRMEAKESVSSHLMCACLCLCVYTFIEQKCARAWMHLHLCVCVCAKEGCSVNVCICMAVCVSVWICVWGLMLAIQADRCQVVSEHRSSDQVETWRRKGESPSYRGATKLLGLV